MIPDKEIDNFLEEPEKKEEEKQTKKQMIIRVNEGLHAYLKENEGNITFYIVGLIKQDLINKGKNWDEINK